MDTSTQPSLLQLAAQGTTLAARLTDYATKHSQEEQLHQLSSTLSFVATVLGCLHTALERYASTLQLKREILTQLQKSSVKDFSYIEKMLDQAAENNRDSILLPYVANYEAFRDLYRDVEELKDHVWVVLDAFTYLALRKLEKTQKLEPEQALDIKRHVDQLPLMRRMLERVESKMKTPLKIEGPTRVETKETVIYENDNETEERLKPLPCIIDDDNRSIISISSIRSDQYLDTPEILECYMLKKEPPNRNLSQKSWRFLGLRLTEQFHDPVYYGIVPQARTQTQLHEQLESLDIDKPLHTSYVERTMSKLPARVREEVDFLVEDRERATLNSRSGMERTWRVVDIENTATEAVSQKRRFWRTERKREETEWMVILRGQTVNANGGEMPQKPDRFADPWRKRSLSRRRSIPRRRASFDQLFPVPVRKERFRAPRFDRKGAQEEAEKKIELLLVEGAGNL